MHTPVWKLVGNCAQLRVPGASAAVDVRTPELGLHNLVLGEQRQEVVSLLGVDLSPTGAGEPVELVEAYSRGHDLIATYATSGGMSRRAQIRWCFLPGSSPPGELAFALWVSVQTAALDDVVGIRVSSRLADATVQRLIDPQTARFEKIAEPGRHAITLTHAEGPGCFVVRPIDGDISYAEMIHPADFRRSRLVGGAADGPALRLEHDLFPERLEKGVILRSRLRGLLVARAGDTARALASYQELIDEEPPLET